MPTIGYNFASSQSGNWINGSYFLADDDQRSHANEVNNAEHILSNFGFSVPAGSVIDGFEIKLEGYMSNSQGYERVEIYASPDGGSNYYGRLDFPLANNNAVYYGGNSTFLWDGGNWTPNAVNNTNFRIKVKYWTNAGTHNPYLDYVQVKVHYSSPPTELNLNETMSVVDSLIRKPFKMLSESIVAVDTLQTLKTTAKELIEKIFAKDGFGGALSFNGTSQYVSVPDDDIFSFSGAFSLECWVKATGVGDQYFIAKDGSGREWWIAAGATGSGKLNFTIISGNNFSTRLRIETNAAYINNTAYKHVVAAWDGTTTDSSGMKIYIDGVSVATSDNSAGTFTAISNGGEPVGIGARGDGAGNFTDGLMDELRVYNRELTPTEVSEHYNGKFANENGLIGYWNFDERTGLIAYDKSDQGNNGDLLPSGTPPAWVDSEIPKLTSGLVKFLNKTISETVNIIDSLLKQIGRVFAEVISLVDSLISVSVKYFIEIVAIADSFSSKIIGKILSETIAITDSLTRKIIRVFSEIIAITDSILKWFIKFFSETIFVFDGFIRQTQKVLNENITIVEDIVKTRFADLLEAIGVSDNTARQIIRVLNETITLNDIFQTLKKIPRTIVVLIKLLKAKIEVKFKGIKNL